MKEEFVSYGNSDNLIEEWRDIVGYEGLYQVSDLGRVKSLDRTVKIQQKRNGIALKPWEIQYKERILKQSTNIDGYKIVQLRNKDKVWYARVHRLVALAFIPNPENKPCVNHIDNTRDNNIISNLEWCTIKENNQYAAKQGRIKGLLGKHHTKETKDRISAKKRGVRLTLEHRCKIALGCIGRKQSEECKIKIGSANKLHGRKVVNSLTGKVYSTIRIASKDIGISESTAYRLLKSNGYLKYVQ